MPMINELHVADLTLNQATQEFTKHLQKLIKNPQVSVELIEASKMQVTISGEVKNSGVFAAPSGSRIMDIITMAGSYTPAADLSRVTVTHPGSPNITTDLSKFLLSGDANMNIAVNSGDNIYIPTRDTEAIGIVTVLGAVRQSGQFQIVKGLTVREAIMLAGGPTEVADMTKVTLRHAGSTVSVPVDYVAANSGVMGANPELRPGDMVYVTPREMLGYYTIYGAVGTPGRFDLKAKTTLTEAIAMAGGVKDRAQLEKTRILRDTNGITQTLQVNVTDIMNGKAANVAIQNQDSIYVNQAGSKTDYLRVISVGASLAWLLMK